MMDICIVCVTVSSLFSNMHYCTSPQAEAYEKTSTAENDIRSSFSLCDSEWIKVDERLNRVQSNCSIAGNRDNCVTKAPPQAVLRFPPHQPPLVHGAQAFHFCRHSKPSRYPRRCCRRQLLLSQEFICSAQNQS
jgi:hypothetical protein